MSANDAILRLPWRMHSAELRNKIKSECDTVYLCDQSTATKAADGSWFIACNGALQEAVDFCVE